MKWTLSPLRRSAQLLTLALLLGSCQQDAKTLCTTYFEPYPDMISDRNVNQANSRYVDAMNAYKAGDHAVAISGLESYLTIPTRDVAPRLYLACSYLAIGEPYKAELQLDMIENSPVKDFSDQVDWYNAMCLLCSGQLERAKEQAEWIAAKPHHTYRGNARSLAADL